VNILTSFRNHRNMLIYVSACVSLAYLASNFLDLPPLIGNWEEKSWSILKFQLNDNYYPPGAAISLIPFLWSGPNFWPAIYFYYGLSAAIYFKLCHFVPNSKARTVALLALPFNPYLTWLCLTSADQVVELTTLLLFGYSIVKKRFNASLLFGFFLCFTRPAYWVAYIVIMYLFGKERTRYSSKIRKIVERSAGILVLSGVLAFNLIVFNSSNLSTSSGDTLFFSHQKYHYLSLPKFDMDVFLKNGPSTDPEKVIENSHELKFIKDVKTRASLQSILENPQRFIFAEMQKLDSYFFSIQKVPNLPGQYELSKDERSILIGDERLSWSLAIGHLMFMVYRFLWLILFLTSIIWIALLLFAKIELMRVEKYLLIPFLSGIVPGLLFYVETRFKICAELLAVPLLMIIAERVIQLAKAGDLAELLSRRRDELS
jgi:hypothetical protein